MNRKSKISALSKTTALFVIALALAPISVHAQSKSKDDGSTDREQDQTQEVVDILQDRKRSAKPAMPFSLNYNVNMLGGYNTNPKSNRQAEGSYYFEPTTRFGLTARPVEMPVKFDTRLEYRATRYAEFPSLDVDRLSWRTKADYVDNGNDQALSPYVAYQNRQYFSRGFDDWFRTRNEFSAGIVKRYNFDGGFNRLAIGSKTSGQTVWQIENDLQVQRRLSVPHKSSTAVINETALRYVPNDDWALSFGTELEWRRFDEYRGKKSQRDFKVTPVANIVWSPFDNNTAAPVFGVKMKYEHNESSKSSDNYSLRQITPFLTVAGKF